MSKKVVIIGAGPSGVLLAHYLLRRDNQYQVTIYERRSDPRLMSFPNARTFPISLNDRGTDALYQIPNVEAAVKRVSLEMYGTVFHQAGKTRVTTRKRPLVTLDRTNLVILLLELLQAYDNNRLNFYFNHLCTQVNLEAKTATIQPLTAGESHTVPYDLLIGADGSHSIVRAAFLTHDLFEFEQKYVLNDYKSIFLAHPQSHPEIKLEAGKIHSWRTNDGTFIVLLHQYDGTMGGVILFPRQHNQVAQLASCEDVLQYFQQHFPEVGQMMTEAEAEAFLKRPITRVLTTSCSHYHYSDSVLLIGDAIHAVSPAIGQGCNAALEDVAMLNSLLNETGDDLKIALEQFTLRRKKDAHALTELSNYSFPSSTRLFIEFILREQLGKLLHRLLPQQCPPSLSQLVFETTVPYAEILKIYQPWINKVKRATERQRNQPIN
ncbi:FAD-dependent monooxygenase [Leptolyngbya sp. NK1-12]|uniref:FAD-dependent monooxygenase n=1 Tax=Leptolyngbya sp. NK1-12 TaxID=2547451 RepID=A0AA96WKP1_9CYAN|nr:NAD(P)/FAD-dependent oxidoreductase [Leptolyngbya sp. NK1-12]WNZ27652.1 FAD-dependent monooxygenase [Leptolyngbya sp. NK1-12]